MKKKRGKNHARRAKKSRPKKNVLGLFLSSCKIKFFVRTKIIVHISRSTLYPRSWNLSYDGQRI